MKPQLRSSLRTYEISVLDCVPDPGHIPYEIAHLLGRQVDYLHCPLPYLLHAPPSETRGGLPGRGRVCSPILPSSRYRRRHLTPHDGDMPRWSAAPAAVIPSRSTSTFSIIRSLTSGPLFPLAHPKHLSWSHKHWSGRQGTDRLSSLADKLPVNLDQWQADQIILI